MENWKAVPGFEGLYEVSDKGRVRSLDRTIQKCVSRNGRVAQLRLRGRVLSPGCDTHGYLFVGLCSDGGRRSVLVHCLVLDAFVGPKRSGQECRHLGGNRTNNALSNLAWGTALENSLDKKRHGTQRPCKGEQHGLSTLTASDVRKIRLAVERQSSAELADEFGISQTHVRRIATRKAWAWLD